MSTSDGTFYDFSCLVAHAHTNAADLRYEAAWDRLFVAHGELEFPAEGGIRGRSVTRDESDAETDETSSDRALAESLGGDHSQGTLDFSSIDGFSSDHTQRSPSEHSESTLTSPLGSPSLNHGLAHVSSTDTPTSPIYSPTSSEYAPGSPAYLTEASKNLPTSPNYGLSSPASLTEASNHLPTSPIYSPTSSEYAPESHVNLTNDSEYAPTAINDAQASPTIPPSPRYAPIHHTKHNYPSPESPSGLPQNEDPGDRSMPMDQRGYLERNAAGTSPIVGVDVKNAPGARKTGAGRRGRGGGGEVGPTRARRERGRPPTCNY